MMFQYTVSYKAWLTYRSDIAWRRHTRITSNLVETIVSSTCHRRFIRMTLSR